MTRGEQRSNREKKKPKREKIDNRRCPEPKGRGGGMAAEPRVRQKEIDMARGI